MAFRQIEGVVFRSDLALSWVLPMSHLGQRHVGHEGVITGCDAFSLRSSIADSRGVANPPIQQ